MARRLADRARVVIPAILQLPERWTFEHAIDCLELTLADLEADQVSLLGHSFGGGLELGLAARLPERIAECVFSDTLGVTSELGLASEALAHPLGDLRLVTVPAMSAFLRSWATHPAQLASAALWAFSSNRERECDLVAKAGFPCHVLWAERDTIRPGATVWPLPGASTRASPSLSDRLAMVRSITTGCSTIRTCSFATSRSSASTRSQAAGDQHSAGLRARRGALGSTTAPRANRRPRPAPSVYFERRSLASRDPARRRAVEPLNPRHSAPVCGCSTHPPPEQRCSTRMRAPLARRDDGRRFRWQSGGPSATRSRTLKPITAVRRRRRPLVGAVAARRLP